VPYEFDFDPVNRIARCRMSGHVTDDDLKSFYVETGKFVALTDPRAGLLDFSAATSFQVSPGTIHDLAKLPPAMPDPARPRVVVAPTPLVFGLMRMFELVGEKTRPTFHVVGTELEAWSVLGVQEPRFEPVGR
jgi:hypothetical protein